jgi:serine/threonine protein kinase
LLERADDLTSLRVSDFGLAIRAGIDKVMSLYVKCGTPAYMAPEMFSDGLYTRSVDMWSVGVILYRLLTKGKYPFVPEELKQLAKNQQLNIEAKFRDIACSPNCMHLLRALLEPDVMKRSPYYVAVEHPFILQEDREPALRYFEVENAQEVTLRLRQVNFPHPGLQASPHNSVYQ